MLREEFGEGRMRLKLSFESADGNDIVFPLHYFYAIHTMIYQTFPHDLAVKLYLEGFPFEKRKFKLFTFSNIIERGTKTRDGRLNFGNKITFIFSTPLASIAEDLGENAFEKDSIFIMGNKLSLSSIEILKPTRVESTMLIKMLSPVTVYSTFQNDKRAIVYYYKPTEEEFKRLIEENAKKKYIVFSKAIGREISETEVNSMHLNIEPYRYSSQRNKKIVYFKDTVIEGYTGVYKLEGDKPLVQITYDSGLGAKSSEGFGMWEKWEPTSEHNSIK